MIRTLDDRFLKHVKELKVGDIFQTDRNGTLPWSQWFFVIEKPALKVYCSPKKQRRWGVWSFPVSIEEGRCLFILLYTKQLHRIPEFIAAIRKNTWRHFSKTMNVH